MDAQAAVDRVWRADAAGMLGVLTRRLGDFGRAEDALQDALAEALRRWPVDGVPDSPAGWLVTTAWRRALDGLRREATGRDKLATLLVTEAPAGEPTDEDRLALVFGCCHPALPVSAQVPLTLRDQATAREAWNSEPLRFFRWFAAQPAFDGTRDGSSCVWFVDLRFVTPGRDLTPFQFGACRESGAWRGYERAGPAAKILLR